MDAEEVKSLKDMGEVGIQILGFKPKKRAIKDWYHVKPALFVYPDEAGAKGECDTSTHTQTHARTHA